MHDERWTTAEDRVVLVLSTCRVTLGPALLQASHFFEPEVPATRTLAKIAADSAEIANLRRRDRECSFGETRKTFAHTGVLLEFSQRNQRTDREPTGVERDVVETTNTLQINHPRRPRQDRK